MRAIGQAELALELMVRAIEEAQDFGKPLHEHGTIATGSPNRAWRSSMARLLVLKTAWLIDSVGVERARSEVVRIKFAGAARC